MRVRVREREREREREGNEQQHKSVKRVEKLRIKNAISTIQKSQLKAGCFPPFSLYTSIILF